MDKEQIITSEQANLEQATGLVDQITSMKKEVYDVSERIAVKEQNCMVIICDEMAVTGKAAYPNETARKAELTSRLSADESHQNDRENVAFLELDIRNKGERVLLIKEHIRFLTALVNA